MISSLLNINSAERVSAEEALQNDWICSKANDLEKKDLAANLEEFEFNAKCKCEVVVSLVIAVNKITLLGKDF